MDIERRALASHLLLVVQLQMEHCVHLQSHFADDGGQSRSRNLYMGGIESDDVVVGIIAVVQLRKMAWM